MNVRYTGPALDYSGYGEANRHDIAALLAAGVNVTVEMTKHCLELGEYGKIGQIIKDLAVPYVTDYKIKILHTTPNIYGQFIEPGKYHIGRVFWETDQLPEQFANGCKMVDEIWTGSEYNKQAIIKAGITSVPIYIIPEVIQPPKDRPEPFKSELRQNKSFVFYSIFEWTERKNPHALLEAYWREFQNNENVALVIKTYLDNFMPSKKREIDTDIQDLKKRLSLPHYPDVYLYRRMLNRDQMYRFHRQFDCFVSAHRGEGWGIPQAEAMAMGKPVISTNCGGIHEYIADVANLIPYKLVPLSGNNRNKQWYCDNQNWAEVDINELRNAMRWAVDHPIEAQELGERGAEFIERNFSPDIVGAKMRDRLEQIQKTLS